MSIAELEKMWKEFSTISINSNDEIEENYYWWGKGTYRFEVWHWCDEQLPNGIHEITT